jgi:hypothetical protein
LAFGIALRAAAGGGAYHGQVAAPLGGDAEPGLQHGHVVEPTDMRKGFDGLSRLFTTAGPSRTSKAFVALAVMVALAAILLVIFSVE